MLLAGLMFGSSCFQIMSVSGRDVLRLYKSLLRYANSLTLSDKRYVVQRIRSETRERKNLTDSADIEYYYKVGCIRLVDGLLTLFKPLSRKERPS